MAKKTMVLGALLGLLLIGGIVGASLLVLEPGAEPDPAAVEPKPKPTRPPQERAPRGAGPETLAPDEVAAIEKRASTPAEPKTVVNRPAIRFEAYGPALDAVEWQPLADTFFGLSRDLPRLGVALASGRLGVPLSQRIDKLRGAVTDLSIPLRPSFPGESMASAWSHPAILANTIAKTLEAAGRPMTDEQLERVRVLGETYLERDATAVAAVTSAPAYLGRTVPQVRVRAAFLAAIRGLLDASQLKVVGGGPYKDRIGLDPFCPGNVWVWEGEVIPLPGDLPVQLEDVVFGMMATWVADGTDERDTAIRAIVKEWIADLDPSLTGYRGGPLSLNGHLDFEQAAYAAEKTGALVTSVLEGFEVSGDGANLLSYHRQVLAPLVMPH